MALLGHHRARYFTSQLPELQNEEKTISLSRERIKPTCHARRIWGAWQELDLEVGRVVSRD